MKKGQDFSYFAVIDFEATCSKQRGQPTPQEIIEFPIVVLDRKGEEVAVYHSYVRPEFHPKLSEFCTELTGITQDQVNAAPEFIDVLASVEQWLQQNEFTAKNTLVVTCGDWDCKTCLPNVCAAHDLAVPEFFSRWCNIKKGFAKVYSQRRLRGMAGMLKFLKMKLEGRHHSGIDDSKNIARILRHMMHKKKYVCKPNGWKK